MVAFEVEIAGEIGFVSSEMGRRRVAGSRCVRCRVEDVGVASRQLGGYVAVEASL